MGNFRQLTEISQKLPSSRKIVLQLHDKTARNGRERIGNRLVAILFSIEEDVVFGQSRLPTFGDGLRTETERQTAYKPGSVPVLRPVTAIHLGRPSPDATRDLPGRPRGTAFDGCPSCRPYLVLLPVGFALPPPLPAARCALTAPFHPCPGGRTEILRRWRFAFCGTVPGVAPAGRYPAPCFRGARTFLPPCEHEEQPSGRLAQHQVGAAGPRVN